MAQEKSIKAATLPLQEVTPVDANNLVNTYADDLISGLFEDVDKLLDGDETTLASVEQEDEAASINPIAAADIESTETNQEATSTALVPTDKGSDADSDAALSTESGTAEPAAPQQKTWLGKLLDRFLLTTTVFSLLGVLGFAVYSYQRGANWVNPLAMNETETVPNQSDIEFLEYLDRSLEIIAKKVERGAAEADPTAAQMPNASVLPASPPLLPPLTPAPSAGGLMAPGGGPVNVIERVYIPYQTAQQPAVPQAPQSAQTPQSAQAPSGEAGGAQVPSGAPAVAHVLVGLLELGDRSAALFEINGVSQRVYIGAPIGSSGWNLVSVTNDEARIRRNGEVRSIYIGQQF